MRVTTLFFIISLLLSVSVNATNYYFSSSQGNDSRSSIQAQNSSTPWKSIDKLDSVLPSLQPGDKVLFKSGDTFYGSIVTTQPGGTSTAPITFSSYGSGAKPVISSLTTMTNWTSLGNGIYETSDTVPTNSIVNIVLINGKQYAMGRYPNVSSGNGGYLNFESFGANYITDNQNPLTTDWIGAQLVVRSNRYNMERSTITDISGNNISYSPAFKRALHNNYGYFIQNDIKTLDQFGEWYYNPNTKRIDVYFGSNSPKRSTVQVATKDILMTIQSSNIIVDNIALRGANTFGIWGDWPGVSNLQVKNCSIDLSGIDGIALANRHDFVMDNTTITNSNSVGVSLFYRDYNPVVKNSTIRNSGTFPGMLLLDNGNRYGVGISSSEGLTATNNQITNSGFMGIVFQGDNNLAQNNYVDTFCTVLDDGGGIYMDNFTPAGQQPTPRNNLKIIGNIVLHGIGAKAGTYETDPNYIPAEGIYLDDNVMNVQVLNNTAAYCANTGMYVHNTKDYTLLGNVLFDNKYRQMAFQNDNSGDTLTGGLIKYNQLFAQSTPEYVMYLASGYNDIAGFGTFDSNYYCRPSNENNIIYTNWFNNNQTWYNLPGWQTAYNQDWNTKGTPVPVSDPSKVLFLYNTSTSSKTFKLSTNYVSVTGVKYSKSVALAPYTSIILLPTTTSARVANGINASAAAVTNTAVTGPGYINTESSKLSVKAYPNPSSSYFQVSTRGGSTSEPITLRVLDMSGRLLQVRTGITANSNLQLGQDLTPGSYVLELIQGSSKVEQKIIKISK